MLVYVSGPYSAETEDEVADNIRNACAAGKALIERGHWPLIPHLNVGYDLWHEGEHGSSPGYEFYLAWDLELVARCDALLRLAPSPGADRELALAQEMGMPIWLSIDDVPRAS